MKPFSKFPEKALARVGYLLSDIDDTITAHGQWPASSYQALEDVRQSGRKVVLITGRPAGWCDMMARFFPIDAVVGENGALCFYRDGAHIRQLWQDEAVVREAGLRRLKEIAKDIMADFPGTALAQDTPWRASDVAVDFCEDVPPLPLDVAHAIAARFADAGATAKVSSIHVNAWFGTYDKRTMFERWLKITQNVALEDIKDAAIYMGDSPNDVPLFKAFPLSVGVSAISTFDLPESDLPAFVTKEDAARGFAQVTKALLRAPFLD